MANKEKLETMLTTDGATKVIDLLLKSINNAEYRRTLTLLSARLSRLNHDTMNGIIEASFANMEKNKINYSLSSLLELIPEKELKNVFSKSNNDSQTEDKIEDITYTDINKQENSNPSSHYNKNDDKSKNKGNGNIQILKIFVASSAELKEDRTAMELFIGRKNKSWVKKGIFLELVMWEDFIDAMSQTRLQDEYNKVLRECDIFVMLFFTKVGRYTEEEFSTAFQQFKATQKPYIYTYFKDAAINTGNINRRDLLSLLNFQEKLKELEHYQTTYTSTDNLLLHFSAQLDKLADTGFIKFVVNEDINNSNTNSISVTGDNNIIFSGNHNSNIKINR